MLNQLWAILLSSVWHSVPSASLSTVCLGVLFFFSTLDFRNIPVSYAGISLLWFCYLQRKIVMLHWCVDIFCWCVCQIWPYCAHLLVWITWCQMVSLLPHSFHMCLFLVYFTPLPCWEKEINLWSHLITSSLSASIFFFVYQALSPFLCSKPPPIHPATLLPTHPFPIFLSPCSPQVKQQPGCLFEFILVQGQVITTNMHNVPHNQGFIAFSETSASNRWYLDWAKWPSVTVSSVVQSVSVVKDVGSDQVTHRGWWKKKVASVSIIKVGCWPCLT